ncbi:GNAT family N-acetyltransferase [Paenibacillus eucommiae]|uniref:GNAT superfamily N-acetyltransferase n=1 Tax=Paenibacillus eucommiae TaxID=1355755 RepID=A0ABS4J5G9_9BACL|nr:GNAT family N-acetyltransferase [Paenibacillus eucommiae]MBP1995072.1 GNAT superfamily N-acetyltransferase [Paenibacillus eucommiae]
MNSIRIISEADIEPYLDIIAEIEHVHLNRGNPNHEQWLRRRISSFYARGAKFFACHDPIHGHILGIVTILHEEAPEGIEALGARAEVLQIGVNKNHRRQGIGSILLKHAEDYARNRGVYCLFMMTYAEDYDVIAFYGKNGFIPVATLPDVYGPRLEGNVFLRKILKV